MAFDEKLARRVQKILENEQGYEVKKMFGGICFMIYGNMACGILNDELIVRVGPKKYEELLSQLHTKKFDITGRPMKGWIMVTAEGIVSNKQLKIWVARGTKFSQSLPPK